MLAIQINVCSEVLHQTNLYINIATENDNKVLSQSRLSTVVSYLENINGAHRGLLRINTATPETSNGTSQLYFTISK
jgi:hypothetical protein